jgi:Fe2+ or Zn2+ uptake regulation protein
LEFKFSISQNIKRQEVHDQLNEQILNYINTFTEESDAENLWLALRANGHKLSQSTFNKRLKELVDAGLITKRSVGYNKYLYLAPTIKPHY